MSYRILFFSVLFVSTLGAAQTIIAAEKLSASQIPLQQLEPIRAQLLAKHEAILSSGVAAKIKKLPFKESQTFKKGALLIEFDCSVENAEHQYAIAEKAKATTTVEVNEQLNTLRSISTLELKTSQAELEMASSKVNLMTAKLKMCKEIAPFNGRIAQLDVKPYQRVKPGDSLMVLYDPSVLDVELRVPSSWLQWIRPGLKFELHIEETKKSYQAKVSTIGAYVDPVSQTVKILGELKTDKENVLPGMSGNAYFSQAAL